MSENVKNIVETAEELLSLAQAVVKAARASCALAHEDPGVYGVYHRACEAYGVALRGAVQQWDRAHPGAWRVAT